MSDQVELTNPVDLSVGGMSGHILRRAIHLAMSFLPFLFFEFGEDVADSVSLSLEQVVSSVILIAIFGEALRLRMGWTVVGQRSYEAKQVSALAWGALGVGMVFLLTPEAAYAYPLILSLSLGDPLLGELRRKGVTTTTVIWAGMLGIAIIWAACAVWVDTPWLLVPLMAPICVAAEWPRLRYIDDNATMLLIPLAVVLIIDPFLGII
ncbi:MAG: hypothetical protein CMB25_03930 [Euryarchaeota archaeon]|nr:hypothetical protein [Euryarchaeota archaeon]|tara:strand:- start:90 stop:713 length:624 start_codon:yes stop_codon:yes gene_type:complete